jgi:hypothetical protein
MASKLFTVDLDLGLNKAKRFIFEDFSTNPSSDLTSGRIIYFTGSGSDQNHLRIYNGTSWKTIAFTDDAPTVSISLDAPDVFTVSGSPAAYNGTLAFEWSTQDANTILAGPSTGLPAIPTFRSLAADDIPSLTATKISNFQEASEDVLGNILTTSTHNGISVSYGDPEGTLALTNTGVVSLSGTTNEVEVTNTGTAYTVGLPDNVTIGGDFTVTGNLTVNGTTTTLNTETLAVEDNTILLNKNVTGTPSADAGLEIERGTGTNSTLIWNETSEFWEAGYVGSTVAIARKYVTTTTGTTHTITHNLGTSDVTVNCWLEGAQVEAAIVVTDSNTVTVTTNSSITDLKTVVVG